MELCELGMFSPSGHIIEDSANKWRKKLVCWVVSRLCGWKLTKKIYPIKLILNFSHGAHWLMAVWRRSAYTWVHLGSLGFFWVHLGSIGFTCVHLGSLWITWVHLGSLGFTRVHLSSLGFTWVHLGSLGFTRAHLGSLEFTRVTLLLFLLLSLLFTMICMIKGWYFGNGTNEQTHKQRISPMYRDPIGCNNVELPCNGKYNRHWSVRELWTKMQCCCFFFTRTFISMYVMHDKSCHEWYCMTWHAMHDNRWYSCYAWHDIPCFSPLTSSPQARPSYLAPGPIRICKAPIKTGHGSSHPRTGHEQPSLPSL